jgi:hypothetical protein
LGAPCCPLCYAGHRSSGGPLNAPRRLWSSLLNPEPPENQQVYDITAHVASHPGWDGAGITTVLSILAALGTDCTADFEEIHRPWPVAWRQLAAYDIGPLAQ